MLVSGRDKLVVRDVHFIMCSGTAALSHSGP